MADTEAKTKEQGEGGEKKAAAVESGGISKMVPMIIILFAVMVCASGGFFCARFFSPNSASASSSDGNEPKNVIKSKPKASGGHGESGGHGGGHGGGEAKGAGNAPSNPGEPWFVELEPVVSNLDEPGVTRYVRATLILEMSGDADYEVNNAILEEKKATVRNWVTIYLAGCTLDDIRGRKNLIRIQSEIKDSLNDMLYKDSKGLVNKILFKEFQIQ